MFGFNKAWLYGAISALLAGLVVFLRMDARKDAKRDAKEADHEHADDIRNRVDRDLADRVRKHDDSGWRD